MKVYLYHRHQPSGVHVHVYCSSDCCYVPEWKIIIGRETSGTFRNSEPFVSEHKVFLDEAEKVVAGLWENKQESQNPLMRPTVITNIREGEVDEATLREAILQCRAALTAFKAADQLTKKIFPETK